MNLHRSSSNNSTTIVIFESDLHNLGNLKSMEQVPSTDKLFAKVKILDTTIFESIRITTKEGLFIYLNPKEESPLEELA